MLASTTQDTVDNANDSIQKELSSPAKLTPPLLTLSTDEYYNVIQQQYGGLWGKFKFEDSLGDFSGEARPFLYVDSSIDLYVLRQFMVKEWKLKPPNLVIPILSAITSRKAIRNLKMIETIKNGMKNVGELFIYV
ncbi:unnamed protein product [Rotaria sp. Silwood2]|nr:unnamed protein product [Rotaria sp. Silwood2]